MRISTRVLPISAVTKEIILKSPAPMFTNGSEMRAAFIASNVSRRRKPKVAFIPAPAPSPCCLSTGSRRKSNRKIWISPVVELPVPAARASTRPIRRCKLSTNLPASSCAADQRSQQKNKERALTILRSRLLERKVAEENAKYAAQRKAPEPAPANATNAFAPTTFREPRHRSSHRADPL